MSKKLLLIILLIGLIVSGVSVTPMIQKFFAKANDVVQSEEFSHAGEKTEQYIKDSLQDIRASQGGN